jgi:hypothetical protein
MAGVTNALDAGTHPLWVLLHIHTASGEMVEAAIENGLIIPYDTDEADRGLPN